MNVTGKQDIIIIAIVLVFYIFYQVILVMIIPHTLAKQKM